jgi:Sel1 repeat
MRQSERPTMRHYAGLLRATLTALLMLAAIVGATVAGPLEDASAAFERRDFATVLRLLRPLADQGNSVAQFILGVMYDNGEGVPQNNAEAMKWYREAADRGEPNAQCNLGTMYLTGQGVPQDYAEALKWYRKAADQGNANAQFNLGKMCDDGDGVPQDYAEALKRPPNREMLAWFYFLFGALPIVPTSASTRAPVSAPLRSALGSFWRRLNCGT